MKNERLTKVASMIMTIIMTVAFVMPSILPVNAEEEAASAVSFLKGKEFNETLKTLAKDTLPSDKSIPSLYLVKDAVITGFERADSMPSDVTTTSISSDGSAVAWMDGTVVKWYAEASTVYMNAESSYMFYGMTSLIDLKGLSAVDFTKLEDASYMFADDTAFTSLDLTGHTAENITNMQAMFANMTSLTSLNINDFATKNVLDMSMMFMNDKLLTALDLSSFTVTADAVTDTVTAYAPAVSSASTASTASPTPTPTPTATTVPSTATDISDIFKDAGLTKIYVGYDWAADITKDARMIRAFSSWFTQTLTMADNQELKDISFTYSLTPGDAMTDANGNTSIQAGLIDENSVVTNASFTNSDPTSKGTPADAGFEGKKYMTKKVKIMIGTSQFTEPGTYRYLVNETTALSGVDSGLYQLDESTYRVLDILVEYKDNTNLSVSSSVLHKTQIPLMGTSLDVKEKSTGFDNSYLLTTNDLVIRNSIGGNQGDSHRVFKYTFEIDGDIAGRQLSVIHSDGGTETITIDENKHSTLEFTLQGTEKITIKGIQKHATYKITAQKEELSDIGYDVKATISNSNAKYSQSVCYSPDTEESCYIMNLSVNEDVDVTFLNIKNGVVPTGIIMDTAPYTVSFFIGMAGILAIRKKRKLDQKDEEAGA